MFDLSDDKIELNVHISAIAAGISIGFVLIVLLVSLWVWSVPQARGYLQRLSFRLLLYSMVWEVAYDISYIMVVIVGGPNPRCAVGVYFMVATLGTVNFIWTCIAINLMLTVVFQINPIILKLERWYIGLSTAIGCFIPIIPAALGHFGWDPAIRVCWMTANDHRQRVINFVMDVYLWQLLSCVIATVCVVMLFVQGRATSRAMFGGDSINHLSLSDPHSEEDTKHSRGHWSLTRMLSKRRKSSHERAFGHLEDRFIRIALRVSLYPLAMIVVNTLIAAGDLFISVNGVKTTPAYALYCVYYWFYGGRGMVFCCLALFVDPCLSKGVYAAWRVKFPTKHDSIHSPPKEPWGSEIAPGPLNTLDHAPVATTMDSFGGDGVAAPQNSLQRQDSGGSMDMLQTLFASEPPHLVEERRQQEAKAIKDAARAARRQSRQSSIASMFWRRGSKDVGTPSVPATPLPTAPPSTAGTPPEQAPPLESPGMTFAGVEDGFLPAGFADLADVVSPEALAQAAADRERQEREERETAAAAQAQADAAAARRDKELDVELDRISEHSSGASTPNLVTTLAYMARGRRASRASAGRVMPGSASAGSGARSPNQGHGSPANYPPSSYPHSPLGPPSGGVDWASAYGPSRASGDAPPADPRARRARALEIAEKLYEDLEQQL